MTTGCWPLRFLQMRSSMAAEASKRQTATTGSGTHAREKREDSGRPARTQRMWSGRIISQEHTHTHTHTHSWASLSLAHLGRPASCLAILPPRWCHTRRGPRRTLKHCGWSCSPSRRRHRRGGRHLYRTGGAWRRTASRSCNKESPIVPPARGGRDSPGSQSRLDDGERAGEVRGGQQRSGEVSKGQERSAKFSKGQERSGEVSKGSSSFEAANLDHVFFLKQKT